MLNKAKILGFLGIESYDLILYIATLLKNLEYKVLIIDNSDTKALTYCIPIPESLNPKINIIRFGEIDFIRDKRLEEYRKEYDYIIVDFGFNTQHKDIEYCNPFFMVTDTQQHNISKIKNIKLAQEDIYLIMKDIHRKRNITYLLEHLQDNELKIKQHYYLYYDEFDKENMIALQYSNEIKLKKLSSQIKIVLNQLFTETLEFEISKIGRAYKTGKRGA